MKLLITSVAFVVFLLPGCIKEEPTSGPTTAEGYVKDFVSGKGVANASVYLTRYTKGDMGAMSTHQVSETTADENGRFSFAFEADAQYQYEVCAQAVHYSPTGVCASLREGQKNTNVEVKIHPFSYIRFHLVNEPPLEYVRFQYEYELDFYTYNDTIVYGKTYSGNHNINILLDKPDRIIIQDTLNFLPLDTLDYTIKY